MSSEKNDMQDENDSALSAEEEMIRKEFQSLLDDYLKSNHRKRVEKITKAFDFANAAHKGIRRRSGDPYIMHPLAVAKIVVNEIGLGSTSVCSALLHDVVEDTDYTVEDIENLFGSKIAQIVDGLTKISGGVFLDHASEQAENFRRLLLTMPEDIRVIMIKIADRLHNMRTLGSMPPAKQYKIAAETQYIYAPLANRLGLFRIKTELENLSFKYDHPDTYKEIADKLEVEKASRDAFFDSFSKPINDKLTKSGYTFTLQKRVKSVYSIWNKMSTRNIPFEEVYDILALRVIFRPHQDLSDKEQCWMLYSSITDIYKPHPERIRDWLTHPKPNGYEALHVTVMGPHGQWVEVQIRTEKMHDVAEKGIAAHWKYKEKSAVQEEESDLDRWLKNIKELLEQNEQDAVDLMDTFKLNMFASEIFVFTPKGELKTIAQGATALDFAFLLHTDLGLQCIGAKVNHKLAPLSYVLKSGDQVEILTSKKQKPQPEWFEYITTARAKSKIGEYFKKQDKSFISKGRKIVESELKELGLKAENEQIIKFLNYYNIIQPHDFFLQVGKKTLLLDNAKEILFKPEKKESAFKRYIIRPFTFNNSKKKEKTPSEEKPTAEKQTIDRKSTFRLTETNAGKEYVVAACCNPIPGDDVLGYIDEKEIVVVHKRRCPIATKLAANHGNQIINAQWATNKGLSFVEDIEIIGIDKKGMMVDILKIISENNSINIQKITIETNAGIFRGHFFVYVHDTDQLNQLIRQLYNIPEVNEVYRIEA
ncbi:MAG: RelA/SpoT family protein [Prevotellaceae bacterium]|jgi:GTP pyrophosphokinase|nr:RelA/SpoT family protein [Prevotellaceae bacterium]